MFGKMVPISIRTLNFTVVHFSSCAIPRVKGNCVKRMFDMHLLHRH